MDHHSADKHYIAAFEYYKDTCIAFGEAAFTQLGEKLRYILVSIHIYRRRPLRTVS